MNQTAAFLGALGVFLIWSSLTAAVSSLVSQHRQGVAKLDRLTPLGGRMEEITLLENAPILDRLFAPFLQDAAATMSHFLERGSTEERLRRAGYPYRTIGDFYAAKMVIMVVSFIMGGGFVVLVGAPKLFVLPLALGAFGLFLPDLQVRRALKRRKKLIATEMAFTLDRIAIGLKAGQALGPAIQDVARRPGGLFIGQLRAVSNDLTLGKSTEEAFDELLKRTPKMEALRSFAEKCILHLVEGFPLARALSAQSDMMREQLDEEIRASGLAGTLKITSIAGVFVLPAAAIVVLGPAFWLAWGIL